MESYRLLINFLQTTIDELGTEYFKFNDRDRETGDRIPYDQEYDRQYFSPIFWNDRGKDQDMVHRNQSMWMWIYL